MAGRVMPLVLAASALMVTGACAHRPTTSQPSVAQFALLPDPDDGTVGRASVSNQAGTTELTSAREATSVVAGKPPSPAFRMEDAEVQRLFGEALAALPPAP